MLESINQIFSQSQLLHSCWVCKLTQHSLWKNTMTLSNKVDTLTLIHSNDTPKEYTSLTAAYVHLDICKRMFTPKCICYTKNLETIQMSINNTKDLKNCGIYVQWNCILSSKN